VTVRLQAQEWRQMSVDPQTDVETPRL